jgi:lipopolysaccharide biosynthesis glycosyltransferase
LRHSIILAADQSYVPHLATAIRSLVENNADLAFNLHVINSDIGSAAWQALERSVTGFDTRLIDTRIEAARVGDLVTRHHISHASYHRLLAPELVPAATALYLDCDLVVTGSLRDLLTRPRDGQAVAAVADPGFAPHPGLGLGAEAGYFNAGVLWLDLDVWRDQDIGPRALAFAREHPDAVPYLDQCALNATLAGAWTRLDPALNVQTGFWEIDAETVRHTYGEGTIAAAIAAPRIVHFTGNVKPWQLNSRHPLKSLYWRYRRQTRFARWLPDDFGLRSLARRLTPAPLLAALGR